MDQKLSDRLTKWHNHIQELEKYESLFLQLEASEKSLYSKLLLTVDGKTMTEREARVYCKQEWKQFKEGLVAAEVQYNKSKRELALKQAAFQAEYLSTKTDTDAIFRMPKEIT